MNFLENGAVPITFTEANQGNSNTSQMRNLNASSFGWQANNEGQQNGLQSLLFNKPSFGENGEAIKGGLNLDNIGGLLKGIGSVASILQSIKALGIAKDDLALQKEAYQTNLEGQRKSYNTALEDRIRSQYVTEGKTSKDVDAYLAKHSM